MTRPSDAAPPAPAHKIGGTLRTWPWQRLSISIIAAMLLMTAIMAVSMLAVSNYSVRRQFDTMPPDQRTQFEAGGQNSGRAEGSAGNKLAQPFTNPAISPPFFQLAPAPSNPGAPPRLSRAERVRRELLNNLIWAVAISGAVAVLFGALLARLISRPVDEVSRAAQQVAGGNLAARARQWPGSVELIHLTQNFNRMAGSLDALERERREMIADIAHELRTPLAVVQARLDAFEDKVLDPTPQELALVLMQIGLLTRLVSDLRTLSLADAGRLPLQVAPLDLAALTARITHSFASKAQAAGIQLDLEVPGTELPIEGDRDRLGQVLVNLLENALRYTPAGERVQIRAWRQGDRALLSVRDAGPGFPAGSETQVFTRFFRADQSRSRDSGGTGLGLAIVAALVQAHHGEVQAGNPAGGGAEVQVGLPLHEDAAEQDWGRPLAAQAG